MGDASMDMPEDLWELVFQRLGDERRMEPLSLVCRRFLALTNRLRCGLTITARTALAPSPGGALPRLFRRFPNLRRIAIRHFHGDLGGLVREVSRSDLQIEVLDLSGLRQWLPRSAMEELGGRVGPRLRALILARFLLLENEDVLAIARLFPNLEELDISHPQEDIDHTCPLRQMVTDDAIAALASNLRGLRSIRLSGNHFLSDNALVSLASNCPLLAEIVAHDCTFMKGTGIAFALGRCRNLTSVSVNKMTAFSVGRQGGLFFQATALRRLSFARMVVPDELLVSIAEAGLPLLEFSLSECSGWSFAGLSAALRAFGRSLRRLALVRLCLISDEMMVAVLPYLGALNSIDLSCCYDLGNITFFSILKNCVCIEKIEMRKTKLGGGPLPADLCPNRRIRHLDLAENTSLDDNTVQHLALVCPQLEFLDVRQCWEVTGDGIGKIGEVCHEITGLTVNGCTKVKNLGTGLGFPKLESLQAGGSGLEDEALLSIAVSCERLLQLDLNGCSRLTEKGVKEVVRECKRLQQLYMGAQNLNVNLLSWIVFSRPLLRKVVWRSGFLPVKMQDFFLRHGCMVSTNI